MSIRTYDPGALVIFFLGNQITGFADGTFLKVKREEPLFMKKVGAGGEVARSKSRNASGHIEFTLMQDSPANLLLTAAVAADRDFGTGIGSFFAKDGSGLSTYISANAWVAEMPDSDFAATLGERTWVLNCDNIDQVVGGN